MKKTNDKPTQWERRLDRDWPDRSSNLSKGIAIEEEVEEEEDKAMKDDDFVCYHIRATIHGGPYLRESSNRPRPSSKKPVTKGKRKELAGPSEGP
ncbi:hypothetical protein GOBAR_DD11312 [Gossypium barbadense]|nr:hypothetical protein GOBAR_DD11312 [Gossypium barbadense]